MFYIYIHIYVGVIDSQVNMEEDMSNFVLSFCDIIGQNICRHSVNQDPP